MAKLEIASVTRKILILLVTTQLSGCLEDAGKTATQNVKEATANLERGMSDVAVAIPKFDPLALKTLIDGNADLRAQVELLRTRLNGLGTLGGVTEVSPDQRVFLQISGYEGSVRIVDVYVDNENAWVMKNKVTPNTNTSLPDLGPIAANAAQALAVKWSEAAGIKFQDWGRDIQYPLVASKFGYYMNDTRKQIDADYRSAIARAFQAYLDSPHVPSTGDIATKWAVDKNLRQTPGAHKVFMRVQPLAPDPSSKQWALDVRLWAEGGQITNDLTRITINTTIARDVQGHELALNSVSAPIEVGQVYVAFPNPLAAGVTSK